MQSMCSVGLSRKEFGRVVERIQLHSSTISGIERNSGYASVLPAEVGLKLTNRCNLRCKHCFQWNETGFHRQFTKGQLSEDLDFGIVERIFHETRPARSSMYLWGGEPLVYKDWDRLADLLVDDPRWTVLCTNGIGLENKLDSILRISPELVVLISVDGFQKENDDIRGPQTFSHIIASIDLLLDLKRRGIYRGEISISCVVSAALAPRLFEFTEFFEAKGVNTVYLVYPWYIPTTTAHRMDTYFERRLGWLSEHHPELLGHTRSWHSYQYRVDPSHIDTIKSEVRRIMSKRWDVRVRFQPALDDDEIADFINGSERPAQGFSRCLSVAVRLNVSPDGTVTTCKQFPELKIGDLRHSSVADVWQGLNATKARSILAEGLTPICSKCVQLYLHGA